MDYNDFTDRNVAYNGFIKLRKEILDSVDSDKFNDLFTDLCARAMANDCIAQDVVAYFFNKGIPDKLLPNYENYMSWQILAGANGNEFSLEKIEFFLNSALDYIVYDTEIIAQALRRKNITKENALYVISNLICEGMADELKLDPKKLVNFQQVVSKYSPEKNRPFIEAMNKSVPKVIEFLLS